MFYLSVAVSYDVNKDGVKVAVLTFTKSAYRLGETVLGVVELNKRTSRARVLSVRLSLIANKILDHALIEFCLLRSCRRYWKLTSHYHHQYHLHPPLVKCTVCTQNTTVHSSYLPCVRLLHSTFPPTQAPHS